ncbi:pseudouridine synthase [Absidia repens]|uniref:Pseudouridine synthase n=1 Tax=Absidia repens TaxID=90262 RepID=A0A1X2I2A3_9FUNG|nr:pseudouridine synthase [Absidia repens]
MSGTGEHLSSDRLLKPLQVVYQDDSYFVVDKPYDCRIQPDPKQPNDLSVEQLVQQQYPDLPPLKNVHQIDYATSGIYVQALTRKAAGKVCKLFEQRSVEKTYLAIVHGHIIPGLEQEETSALEETTTTTTAAAAAKHLISVDKPIGNDPSHPFRMAILPTGKPSFTTIQVIQQGYYHLPVHQSHDVASKIPVTKVLLFPKTGRRHQLRVHLQSIGHPIIGDFNYETPYTDTFRMMLHAYKIHFPLSSGAITIETKDPFVDIIENS